MTAYDERLADKAAAFAAARTPESLQALTGTAYTDSGRLYAAATGHAQCLIEELLRVNAALRRGALERLRAELAAAGYSADSPATLDAEAERLAREERWT